MAEITDTIESLREIVTRLECGGLAEEDTTRLSITAHELIGSVIDRIFRVMRLLTDTDVQSSKDFFVELFGEECCREWEAHPDKKMADIGSVMEELRYFEQALRHIARLS